MSHTGRNTPNRPTLISLCLSVSVSVALSMRQPKLSVVVCQYVALAVSNYRHSPSPTQRKKTPSRQERPGMRNAGMPNGPPECRMPECRTPRSAMPNVRHWALRPFGIPAPTLRDNAPPLERCSLRSQYHLPSIAFPDSVL